MVLPGVKGAGKGEGLFYFLGEGEHLNISRFYGEGSWGKHFPELMPFAFSGSREFCRDFQLASKSSPPVNLH